ncbi:MAG TPA: hypothetical protein VFR47_19715 [Anaerolineales bacterium]|nr:hypothetical protein [Anaerolineales bacterium]
MPILATEPTQIAATSPINSYEASDLVGIWLLDQVHDDTIVSFHADGTYARDAGRQLVTKPATFGTYTVNDNRLIFNVRVDQCPSAGQYIWEISIPDDGLLTSVVVEDTTCYGATGIESSWIRLSPNSQMELSPPSSATAAEGIPARASNLKGIWYLVGSSTLISFPLDGTYVYDDRGTLDTDPIDSGTYEAVGSTVKLTSGSNSRECTNGDVLLLEDVKIMYPSWWLIGRVVQDSCGTFNPEIYSLRLCLYEHLGKPISHTV